MVKQIDKFDIYFKLDMDTIIDVSLFGSAIVLSYLLVFVFHI